MSRPETENSLRLQPSAGDIEIIPFLKPGERFIGNYSLTPLSSFTPLDVYIAQLLQSGRFLSVRTDQAAVFEANGRPYTGAVAIFVVPIPEE